MTINKSPFTEKELGRIKRGTFLYKLNSLDQTFNAFLGGNEDQTFSARSWEAEQKLGGAWKVIRRILDTLFWFEPEHCHKSFWIDPKELSYPEIKKEVK